MDPPTDPRPEVKRVLQIASGDLWGGAEACVLELCSGLRDAGIETSAVLMNPGVLASRLEQAAIPVQIINEADTSSPRIIQRLRSIMHAQRPDVVHTHRMKENILTAISHKLCAGPFPALVRTIHGADEHATSRMWSRRRLAQVAERLADRAFDARVAVSEELAGRLRAASPGKRFATIHNGIRPAPTGALRSSPNACRVIGFAGRLTPVKRVDLILDTAHHLMQQHEADIRFEIAGDGPLRDTLVARSESMGLTGMVHFLGFMPDIWSALRRWDVLILASDHEGLPMICLESLAAGVPIVARAVGGLEEVILGPRQGALVRSGNPEALAQAILAVLRSTREEHGGASRLPDQFSSKEMCRRYMRLYDQVARERRR